MATLSLRIPDSYHTMVKEIAERDDISINQFIISAVAEKISALETQDYLNDRASSGVREKFLNVLKKVPDSDPDEEDK